MGQGMKGIKMAVARGTVTHRPRSLVKHFWRGNKKPEKEFWCVIY